ncbi:hypothetical protein [Halomonas sp.]|uniref:hypothetical protein n=1 Tax=Halomonas sp. TaxID=1486246 RepID=UPI00356200C6
MFGDNNDNDSGNENENESATSFLGGLYERSKSPEPEPVEKYESSAGRWSLGSHTADAGIDTEQLDSAINQVKDLNPGLADVLTAAKKGISESQVTRFECNICGLGHTHQDHKHDIREEYASNDPGFGVTDQFVEEMEFCPYCHCGVNELSMLIDFFGYLSQPVFEHEDFDAVLGLDPDSLMSYCQTRRNLVLESEPSEEVTNPQIFAESSISEEEGEYILDNSDEFDEFYNLWMDIKSAANGAPIAGETRDDIAELREIIVEAISEESESDEAGDDYDHEGFVSFYN